MVFSHLIFIYGFLPLLMALYYCRKSAPWRRGILLIFSLLFYGWGEPVYILLMLGSALMNYLFGQLVGPENDPGSRKFALITAVVFNLALLGLFKYAGFLMNTVNGLTGLQLPVPSLRLPLGISFYTFQAMTYVIDVYRGQCQVQKKYSKVLLYICLFPQLVAGPIVRYTDVAEQLENRRVNAGQINTGIWRFTIGLSKKVIFSNTCGLVCQNLFSYGGTTVLGNWCGILFYALQIYFDFSGYSDMAIGLGHMFGFIFPENFNYPYISRSVTEFWRRWHITLSSWFRDYVYIPLGGNRCSKARWLLNLLIVWMLTGLWHGANWNFVLWGLYYGLFLILEKTLLKNVLKKLPAFVQHLYSIFVILVGWMLFYFEGSQALVGVGKLFGIGTNGLINDYSANLIYENGLLLIAALICATPLGHTLFEGIRGGLRKSCGNRSAYTIDRVIKAIFILILLGICTVRLVGDSYNPFIYFRF